MTSAVDGHRPDHTTRRDVELADSWQRSRVALGDPGNIHDVPHVPESLLDEHLLDMLGAPMARFADDIDGTGLALLLADARGQILQRWFEDRQAESHLDRVGTVRGAVLAENVVGTNGVGTVVASGRPVQITGDEHYADFYKDAVCTGAPVLHPITRNLVAVVTLSCDLTPRSELLRPLVRSIANGLEQHLLSVEHPEAREMLSIFLDASREHRTPVVAFGPHGAMIQNAQAGSLTPHDMALLRSLGEERRPPGSYTVQLTSGTVLLDFTPVGLTNNVVALRDQPRSHVHQVGVRLPEPMPTRSAQWLALTSELGKLTAIGDPVLIAGERGVGKLTLAHHAVDGPGAVTLNAAELHILGTRQWLARLSESFRDHPRVIVRGVETLDAPALDGLSAVLDAHADVDVIMTYSADDLAAAEPVVLQLGARPLWVPPLRARTEDLPELWCTMVAALSPRARLELTDEAHALLRSYAWPGNVKELRRLVRQLVTAGKSGLVTASDLPANMQSAKNLTMIERVELEAIRKALQEAGGNRVRAADILGVSRATVYRKMKTYRIGG